MEQDQSSDVTRQGSPAWLARPLHQAYHDSATLAKGAAQMYLNPDPQGSFMSKATLPAPSPAEDEAALDLRAVQAVLAGDAAAFRELLTRHKDRVARIAAGHVPADKVAEVTQDCFVRAYRSLSGFRAEKPFSHWLSSIAVRACCDHWRQVGRTSRETSLSALPGLSEDLLERLESQGAHADEDSCLEENQRLELRGLLRAALDRLSAEDRTVLTLVYIEELSGAETAKLMGISLANVKIRAFRARRRLRDMLSKALPEGYGG